MILELGICFFLFFRGYIHLVVLFFTGRSRSRQKTQPTYAPPLRKLTQQQSRRALESEALLHSKKALEKYSKKHSENTQKTHTPPKRNLFSREELVAHFPSFVYALFMSLCGRSTQLSALYSFIWLTH